MTSAETPGAELEVQPAPARPANIDRELTDSWVDVIRPITILAGQIADTEFVPKAIRGNAPAVAAVILHGREVGIPPMTALSETHLIEGRPALSAKLLRSRILAAGHEFEIVDSTGARCEVRGRRRGQDRWTHVIWTIDMARSVRVKTKNGTTTLAAKDNWQNYPRRMLIARATSELADSVFPDVCLGMGAAEVLADEAVAEDEQSAAPVPKTSVSRARKTSTTQQAGPPEQPADPTDPPPAPLEVDIPMPGHPPAPPGEASSGPEAEPTDAEVVARAAAEAPERDEPAEVVDIAAPPRVTPAQLRMLGALWSGLGVKVDQDRHAFTAQLVGHDLEGGTTKALTKIEASGLIDKLTKLDGDPAQLDHLVQGTLVAPPPEHAPES